jgi:beta propeller repeat protein
MKARLLCALLAGALFVLAVPASAMATQVVDRFTVLAATATLSHADISADIVVFQKNDAKKDGSGWNVYGHSIATDVTFPICTALGDQVHPSISGSLVVWEDHRAGNADIYSYDLGTSAALPVCLDLAEQRHPRVDGGWVVWQDHRNDDWDIYGWRIGDPAGGSVIYDGEYDQTEPDVSGDNVVWTDPYSDGKDKDIRGYNSVADYVFKVCVDGSRQDQPAISGDTVVWRDARNAATGGTDIYSFGLQTSSESALTTTPGDQSEPAISGDLVLWTDRARAGGSGGVDVWAYDTAYDQPIGLAMFDKYQGQPAVDGYTAVWSDTRDSATADLMGAELTPWFADLRINSGQSWANEVTVELFPYGRSKGGIVTEMSLWNDGAPAVWEPYATTKSTWYLPAGDGVKKVRARFRDLSGGESPAVYDAITLDTHGPLCKVPSAVSVASGDVATIKYRVDDNLARQADVTIRITTKGGATVKIMILGRRPTGKLLSEKVLCNIGSGVYKIVVKAKDLAGNPQSKTGINTLTVGE